MTRGFIKSHCTGGLSSMPGCLDALPKSSLVSHEAQERLRFILFFLFTKITRPDTSFNLTCWLLCFCMSYSSFCLWLGSWMPSCMSEQHCHACIKTSRHHIVVNSPRFSLFFPYSHLPILPSLPNWCFFFCPHFPLSTKILEHTWRQVPWLFNHTRNLKFRLHMASAFYPTIGLHTVSMLIQEPDCTWCPP